MKKPLIILAITCLYSTQVMSSTPVFDHNSKLGMCGGLAKISNIKVDQEKLAKSIDRSEGQERTLGAMSYGGGYAIGLIDMYQTIKPNTRSKSAVAKQIFEQAGCSQYQ